MFRLIISILFLTVITACNEDAAGGMKAKPMALGVMNQIVVIADEDLWESPVKDTFEFYFESAYPIMPRPEPMFDLRYFSPEQIDNEPLRRELRTYVVLADLSEDDSRAVKMIKTDLGEERYRNALNGEMTSIAVKDKWARNQLLVYLMGKDRNALNEAIRTNYPGIARRVNRHDIEQLKAMTFAQGINLGLKEEIGTEYGLYLEVPRAYKEVEKDSENFRWLKKDDKHSIMNIVIQSFDYRDQNQISKDSLIAWINSHGKEITSSEPNSYLEINDVDLPVFEYVYDIDGVYTKEIRGIWEMNNDYMGGPFAAYGLVNNVSQKITFVHTFVYAPGAEKRNMMQQLDMVIKSSEVAKANGNG